MIISPKFQSSVIGNPTLKSLGSLYLMTVTESVKAQNSVKGKERAGTLTEEERKSFIRLQELIAEHKKGILNYARELLDNEPVYTEFLQHIKGVGLSLALRLMSTPFDINKELSDWYAYCGLVPLVWKCECEHGHKFLKPYDPLTRAGITCPVKVKKKNQEIEEMEVGDEVDEEALEELSIALDLKDAEYTVCGGKIVSSQMAEPRSHAGYLSFWNPKAKNLIFLFGKQFSMGGAFYKEIYKEAREKELAKLQWRQKAEKILKKASKDKVAENEEKEIVGGYQELLLKEGANPMVVGLINTTEDVLKYAPKNKLQIIYRAYRKVFKLFLAHYYQAMRELYGMPYRLPYQFEYLQHANFVDWKDVVEFDKRAKRGKKSKK